MERTGDDLKEKGLEQAMARLERAETDLRTAEAAEEAAEKAEKVAEHEIHEALQEIKEAEAHHHHEIHFTVDGEQYETMKQEMTPDEIIREFGLKDPATNYLAQIEAGQRVSYQGKGNEPIMLHDGMKFQIISIGPTPVSNCPIRTGIDVFTQGLRDLGYTPVALPGRPDHLVIDYEVETGRFAGQKVRHGLIIPADFPVTPPSGPHVSPHIHPIKADGDHPTGHVHQSHSLPFEASAGGQWQYWSRPFPGWAQIGKKSVAAYMSHVWRLWDSQ